MDSRVLDHEPGLALFVEDSDPLIFYRRIGVLARELLSNEGLVYLELNSKYADDCAEMFTDQGWQVRVYQDMSGNKRFLKLWA